MPWKSSLTDPATRRLQPIAVVVLLLAGLCVAGSASATVLTLDPNATRIEFSLDGNMHDTHGTMRLSSGVIEFDPSRHTASGRIVVDVASGDTSNEKRDKKMHNGVLETAEFPEIVFEPQGFSGQLEMDGHSTITVKGTMTIHGASHPIEMTADLDTADGEMAGAAIFTIPYVEWGLKNPSAFIFRVAREVDIVLQIHGRLSDGPPASAGGAGRSESPDSLP